MSGFFNVLYSTLLHLPPLRFYCVGGRCDRTLGAVTTLDALATRLDLIHNHTLSDWFCIPGLTTAREDVIDTLVVETAYGNVRGFSKLVLGTKLYVFYGIPYAKPPIGKRRCERKQR